MKKILIVEDDKKIALALCVRLKSAGYEVVMAHDAVMGVGTAVKEQPDLVILDISMPAGDGFKVAERMQNLTKTAGTPFIFMTASKKPEFREKAMEMGALAFFEKPYEADEVLAAVRDALKQPEPQDAVTQ